MDRGSSWNDDGCSGLRGRLDGGRCDSSLRTKSVVIVSAQRVALRYHQQQECICKVGERVGIYEGAKQEGKVGFDPGL